MDNKIEQLHELKEIKSQINVQLEVLEYLQTDIYYNSREGELYFSTQEHIEQQIKDTIHSLIDLITFKIDKGLQAENLVNNFINDVLHKLEKRGY